MGTGGRPCEDSEEAAIYKPRRETNPDSTLTLAFQPPELRENKLLLFKPPQSVLCCHGSQANTKDLSPGTEEAAKGLRAGEPAQQEDGGQRQTTQGWMRPQEPKTVHLQP